MAESHGVAQRTVTIVRVLDVRDDEKIDELVVVAPVERHAVVDKCCFSVTFANVIEVSERVS